MSSAVRGVGLRGVRAGAFELLETGFQALAAVPYGLRLHLPIVQLRRKLFTLFRSDERALEHVNGQRKILFHDLFLPLAKGNVGIGVSSEAKAAFADVHVTDVKPTSPLDMMMTSASGTDSWITCMADASSGY